MATEVTHRGGVALTHFDESGFSQALERLPDRGSRYAEHLGEPPLTRQSLTRGHVAAEHLGNDLLEDVLGYRPTIYRLQCHAKTMAGRRSEVKWSYQCRHCDSARRTRVFGIRRDRKRNADSVGGADEGRNRDAFENLVIVEPERTQPVEVGVPNGLGIVVDGDG
jgi:hypothetical protein